jgi:hypothetical protein
MATTELRSTEHTQQAELTLAPTAGDRPLYPDGRRAEAARRLAQQIDARAREYLSLAEQLTTTLSAARSKRQDAWRQQHRARRRNQAGAGT